MIEVVDTVARRRSTDVRHHLHHLRDGVLQSITLAELDGRASAVARHLRESGVGRGDRVGVMARNSLEWVVLDLAVLQVGGVTAGFEPGRFEPGHVVEAFGLAVLFVDGPAGTGRVRDIADVAAWSTGERAPGPLHDGYDPADICAVKFTSGSTGMPKGLEVTVASVDSALDATQEMFRHGDGDNLLVFLGQWFLQQRYWIYSALVFGHDVTLAGVDDALTAARASAPTVVMGVPGFYEDLKVRIESSGTAVDREVVQAHLGGRVRYLWTGSAPAGRAVLEFFHHHGVPLYEGYGLNETCIVAKNHPGAFRLGSVGRPLPGKRVRVDRDGVLVVGSTHPVNTRYTWSAPGVGERTFLPTGEVRTHDLGWVDDDGFLFVQGRADDVIALGTGYNVLAPVVEHRLRDHPAVHDCVVHGSGRAFLVAVVSPAAPDTDHDELRRHVAALNDEVLTEQRVHAVVVAPERFTPANGLVTGQYKPRRREIHARYADELEAAHAARPDATAPLVVAARTGEGS